MEEYDAVIGLEVHVQINTKSKMFCSCPNAYGASPNTMVCPICMGYPGTLPVPNHKAIKKTIAAGLLCSCEIADYSKFDRKSYFYPDMPKNYQISQYDLPFCKKGFIHISGQGFSGEELPDKNIGINRIHLEEDVAKSVHFTGYSGIDFNRAGVPLMEIVSEPEMNSADEAYAYLTALKQMMQYSEISDCDMEKGQMRCDVNISVKPSNSKTLGTKIEIKNLNSFRAVHRSLIYEIKRQINSLISGKSLNQETRGWDDDLGESYLLRSKEDAHDYRYFPEPDLMPLSFTENDIECIKNELPELPEVKRQRFINEFDLTPYDAKVLTAEKKIADYFAEGTEFTKTPKLLANWIISELLRELSQAEISIDECKIVPKSLAQMITLINDGTINGKIAKTIFTEMFKTGKTPQKIVKEGGFTQVTDETAIQEFVSRAITENPKQVEQYMNGNEKVLQYFVGQTMKLSKGKANPQIVIKLLKEKLDSNE